MVPSTSTPSWIPGSRRSPSSGRALRGPVGCDPRRRRLCNNVRRDLIFDEGDAVAQLQLALFQPLQPQQIRRRRLMQGIDRRIEVAMLLVQPSELGFKFALIFVGHWGTLAEKRG